MTKKDLSSRHFQRKISEFCELRIAPITSKRVLENVRPYLVSLIIYRQSPPFLNGHLDWTTIGQSCGIEAELTAELKKQLRPGLDAIIRWLGAPLAASPNSAVKGYGVPLSRLSFGLLIFPGVWDWYRQWREQRRGFYTKWEEDMLMVAQALSRADVDWIRQHPELLHNVRPIAGLI